MKKKQEIKEKLNKYEIRYLNADGEEMYQKGVINDYPVEEILKKHSREFGEPRVVWLNGRLTGY